MRAVLAWPDCTLCDAELVRNKQWPRQCKSLCTSWEGEHFWQMQHSQHLQHTKLACIS